MRKPTDSRPGALSTPRSPTSSASSSRTSPAGAATRSRAFVHQDLVVCVFEDGATRAEQNLVAAGEAKLVRIQRDALQRALAPQLVAAVERLTSRTVRTFMSGMDEDGAASIEAFLLEPEPLTASVLA